MRSAHIEIVRAPLFESGDRRQDPRFPSFEPGTARLADSPPGRQFAMSVLNMSRNGMKVGLDRRVDVGAEIEIALKNYSVRGEVRYCIPAAEGFHAGILVKEATLIPLGSDRPIRV